MDYTNVDKVIAALEARDKAAADTLSRVAATWLHRLYAGLNNLVDECDKKILPGGYAQVSVASLQEARDFLHFEEDEVEPT